MKRGQPLSERQQNAVRVAAAALLAVAILMWAIIFNSGQPESGVVSLFPLMFLGLPALLLNYVAWRCKMLW